MDFVFGKHKEIVYVYQKKLNGKFRLETQAHFFPLFFFNFSSRIRTEVWKISWAL